MNDIEGITLATTHATATWAKMTKQDKLVVRLGMVPIADMLQHSCTSGMHLQPISSNLENVHSNQIRSIIDFNSESCLSISSINLLPHFLFFAPLFVHLF